MSIKLGSVIAHERMHALGLPEKPRPGPSQMQRQVQQWVKLGAQRQLGVAVVFAHSSWSGPDEFTPITINTDVTAS